ncbi:MAG: hypothetical protein EOP35_01385 [Rubrivivax sp.]|nr:MAG: hypothetical protein EOP35_01385 [Rubrivivax sp.]
MNALARALLIAVLAVGVLGFGAIGLCGGYFTVAFLPELFGSGGSGSLVFLVLSLPCLLGGFFMVWVCARKIGSMLGQPQQWEDVS